MQSKRGYLYGQWFYEYEDGQMLFSDPARIISVGHIFSDVPMWEITKEEYYNEISEFIADCKLGKVLK